MPTHANRDNHCVPGEERLVHMSAEGGFRLPRFHIVVVFLYRALGKLAQVEPCGCEGGGVLGGDGGGGTGGGVQRQSGREISVLMRNLVSLSWRRGGEYGTWTTPVSGV